LFWSAETTSTQPCSTSIFLEHTCCMNWLPSHVIWCQVEWEEVSFLSGALKGALHLRIQSYNVLPNIISFSAFTFSFFFKLLESNIHMCFQFGSSTFPVTMAARGELDLSPSELFIKTHTPLCPFTLLNFLLNDKMYTWCYIFNFGF